MRWKSLQNIIIGGVCKNETEGWLKDQQYVYAIKGTLLEVLNILLSMPREINYC